MRKIANMLAEILIFITLTLPSGIKVGLGTHLKFF
jgi:hypothetical protein